jgi:hypothetical protein
MNILSIIKIALLKEHSIYILLGFMNGSRMKSVYQGTTHRPLHK